MSRQCKHSNGTLTPRQGLPCRCCCAGAWARWQLVLGQRSHVCATLQQHKVRHSALQCSSTLAHSVLHCMRSCSSDLEQYWAAPVFQTIMGEQNPWCCQAQVLMSRHPIAHSAKTVLWTVMAPPPRQVQDPGILHQTTSSGSQARTPLPQHWLADAAVPTRPELDGGHALRALQLLQEGQRPRLQVRPCNSTLAHHVLLL